MKKLLLIAVIAMTFGTQAFAGRFVTTCNNGGSFRGYVWDDDEDFYVINKETCQVTNIAIGEEYVTAYGMRGLWNDSHRLYIDHRRSDDRRIVATGAYKITNDQEGLLRIVWRFKMVIDFNEDRTAIEKIKLYSSRFAFGFIFYKKTVSEYKDFVLFVE